MGVFFELIGDHRTIQRTVGKGKPGPKTLALRKDGAAIEKVGLFYPDHTSFTPKFFSRFLWESKALKADSFEESKRRIKETEFSQREKEAIMNAIRSFPFTMGYRFMVRSDDYAAGVGLWHTGTASVKREMNIDFEGLGKQIEVQMKEVLASDFDENVRIFKAKKELTGNPGVMLMPVFGEAVGEPYGDMIAPIMSINYLGKVNGLALSSIGAGIGGANKKDGVLHHMGHYIRVTDFLMHWWGFDAKVLRVADGSLISADISEDLNVSAQFMLRHGSGDQFLNPAINDLISETGPRYLEIVKDDVIRPQWVVVQSSPFEVRKIDKPEFNPDCVAMETWHAVGTKIVEAEKIRLAELKPLEEDREYNEQNQDYVLIIDPKRLGVFEMFWTLADFSNAAAIILLSNEIKNPLASHLNGYMRGLDIPVLAGSLKPEFLKSLEKQPEQKLRCTVYANEFEQEGLLIIG